MKKYVALVMIAIFTLSGCVNDESSADSDKTKVGFVTDTGGISDKSFNQGTWEGIDAYAKENDIEASYIESKDESQIESNLNVSAQKNDLVIAAGYAAADPMARAAAANPDTDFVLIDAEPQEAGTDKPAELDNVQSFLFREEQAGYLVGYVAGKETKTNKVGYIGGVQNPAVQRFGLGFVQGVEAANDKAEVLYNYTGSFSDVAKGKTTATTMYNSGADIIFTAAGGVNAGVISAAIDEVNKGKDAWVIGVDRDCYEDGIYDGDKSVILTSAVKQVGNAAQTGIEQYVSGDFSAGAKTLGYDEKGIGLPEENPNVDEKIVTEAKDALEKADIASTKEATEKKLTIKVNGDM